MNITLLQKIEFIKPKSAIAIADSNHLKQVILNLIDNAIKFNIYEGKILIKLAKTKDDQWHFSITDSGIGIPKTELENIFETFSQSSRTKTKAGGTGLGLSLCKQIIEAHHGKIWAENNIDSGSSFHFTIPKNGY